jgi:hypothetical protein
MHLKDAYHGIQTLYKQRFYVMVGVYSYHDMHLGHPTQGGMIT